MLATSDLCDRYFPDIQLVAPGLQSLGGKSAFYGKIVTLRVHEDSGLVKQVIAELGNGRILVIDGGGSMNRALTGDKMAELAMNNGWAGLVYNGCVRDLADIAGLEIGLLALGACPVRPAQDGAGERDIEVEFLGARFVPGSFLYADRDGVILSEVALSL